MKEFSVQIPNSWDDISVRMFTEIATLDGNPFEKMIKVLSLLTGIDEKEVKSWPAVTVETSGITQKLAFLTKEPIKRLPSEKLVLNGKRYSVNLYPGTWTAAQYLDYSTVLGDESDKKIARLIACFCVPENRKYGEDYDFAQVVDDIYDFMPITVALGYASFFQLQLESYAKAIQRYTSRKKSRRLTRRQASRLMKRGPKADSTPNGTASY